MPERMRWAEALVVVGILQRPTGRPFPVFWTDVEVSPDRITVNLCDAKKYREMSSATIGLTAMTRRFRDREFSTGYNLVDQGVYPLKVARELFPVGNA